MGELLLLLRMSKHQSEAQEADQTVGELLQLLRVFGDLRALFGDLRPVWGPAAHPPQLHAPGGGRAKAKHEKGCSKERVFGVSLS